jgi:hypothetical protein
MLIGVAAVAVVVGCGAGSRSHAERSGVLGAGQERGSWATAAELAWLRKLGRWETTLMRSLDRAGHASSDAAAAPYLGPVRSCSQTLDRQVGRPPTTRLVRALDAVQAACGHLERAADAPDASTAAAEGRAGGKQLLRADQMVPPGEVRALPVVAGASTQSHVDPKLSRIASDLVGKDVEVRCWSRVDWTHLLREEKAYTLHHLDDNTLGFAGVGGSRDNLAPEVCDNLDELQYQHWMPSAVDSKLLLATAVVTLSHEPQHSKGIAVEAQAECYAIQVMRETAQKLGATPGYAAELQRIYWQHYGDELPTYRSAQCASERAYDLDRARTAFP